MKLLLSVIALAFATPAFAQSAPADQHAGHAHQAPQPTPPAPMACTAEHAAMGHCKPSPRGPAAPSGQQAGQGRDGDCCKKDANGKMACCEKMRAAGKDCCDEDGKPPANPQSGHSGH
jgi:hypothetical protein